MNYKLLSRILILLILSAMIIFMVGCDRRSIDLNAIDVSDIVYDKDILYEDNGATYIDIWVIVKDADRFPLYGQQIKFKSNVEQIRFTPPSAFSDSLGIVRSQVTVVGKALPASVDSLKVSIGAYIVNTLKSSAQFQVRRAPDITEILLDNTIPGQTSLNQLLTIKARPQDALGNIINDGTRVTFVTTRTGYFLDNGVRYDTRIEIPVKNGVAETVWNAGPVADVTEIYAQVGSVKSVSRTTEVMPGTPNDIRISSATTVVTINGPQEEILASLADRYGNRIAGKSINFATTLGFITAAGSTNEDGITSVQFTPGSQAGQATITATADSATASYMINILSDEVAYITFINAAAIDLGVQGSGIQESATVSVNLRDMAGNIINEDKRIRFTIVSAPAGVLMDQRLVTQLDKTAYGGMASVNISSGTASGPVTLRATLLDENEQPTNIVVSKANIIIHSGPPRFIAVSIDEASNATTVSSAYWKISVSAQVSDELQNPVVKGTGVSFSLVDAEAISDSISIVAQSSTGNVSVSGDSAAGRAYTTMIYHGRLSNKTIKIRAKVNDAIFTETQIVLPMNNLSIELVLVPSYLQWQGGNLDSYFNMYKDLTMRVHVKDGQNNPIWHAPLTFSSDKGEFRDDYVGFSNETPPDLCNGQTWPGCQLCNTPFDALTNNQGNQAKKWFMAGEFPPGTPEPPAEITATLTVEIIGHGAATSREATLRAWF